MAGFKTIVQGRQVLASFKGEGNRIKRNAVLAVNKTSERTRTKSARAIRQQVNLPASYLSPSGGRLVVAKKATTQDLTSIVRGRNRPTSLARFAAGTPRKGAGVTVQVKPGRARHLKRAFLIRLRAGSGVTDTKFNLGLAVRLRPGETINNKKEAIRSAKGLYILYGPSVGQVFAAVSEDELPEAARFLESEFLRLMDLNNGP